MFGSNKGVASYGNSIYTIHLEFGERCKKNSHASCWTRLSKNSNAWRPDPPDSLNLLMKLSTGDLGGTTLGMRQGHRCLIIRRIERVLEQLDIGGMKRSESLTVFKFISTIPSHDIPLTYGLQI